jgi:hypothetical protein
MVQSEKVNLSFEMALATLISPSIFNYSELVIIRLFYCTKVVLTSFGKFEIVLIRLGL